MDKCIPWLVVAVQLGLVVGVGGVLWLLGLPIWIGLLLGLLSLVANALLLRWEDRQPGGFDDL